MDLCNRRQKRRIQSKLDPILPINQTDAPLLPALMKLNAAGDAARYFSHVMHFSSPSWEDRNQGASVFSWVGKMRCFLAICSGFDSNYSQAISLFCAFYIHLSSKNASKCISALLACCVWRLIPLIKLKLLFKLAFLWIYKEHFIHLADSAKFSRVPRQQLLR